MAAARRHTSRVTHSLVDGAPTGPFVQHLGLDLTEVSGDRVVATWVARPDLHQPYGIVHGGVHCSVVETLASFGAATWLGQQGQVVGVNNNTDFFWAVATGPMRSVATPLHRGRSQQVWVVETRDDLRLRERTRTGLLAQAARDPTRWGWPTVLG